MDFNLKSFFKKKEKEDIRNLAIIAHVDSGKTTLTDNLLAQVGVINKNLAGVQLATDCYEEEQKRGITINSSAISFNYKNKIFNLIDTPGHTDFNSQVSGALRTIDGAVLVIDCIEGIKTQTETVLAQAIKQNVSIVLFINKIDRMISELYVKSEEVFAKIQQNINNLNALIKKMVDYEDNYFVIDKNVIFGSALNKWGLTVNQIKQRGINFKQVLDQVKSKKDLSDKYNLAECILDVCVDQIEFPGFTQAKKIQRIFEYNTEQIQKIPDPVKKGSIDSEFFGVVTDVNYDRYAGLLYTVRCISGNYNRGDPLYASFNNYETPIKTPNRLSISMIKKYQDVDNFFSGTIVVLQGTSNLSVGDTVSSKQKAQFKFPKLKYTRDPVVSVALAPKKIADTKKMIQSVNYLVLEDPSLNFEYNEENKEFLLYGVGVLHLEVSIKKLELIYNVEVISSPPTVTYSETIPEQVVSEKVSVRTSNKHNDFEFYLFRLPNELTQKLLKSEIAAKSLTQQAEKAGIRKDLAKRATKILPQGCIYFDDTKGATYMEQMKDTISKSIALAFSTGFKLNKPLKGVGFVLTFAKIHEDNLHRGVNQLRGAYRQGLQKILSNPSNIQITEPILDLYVDTPYSYINTIVSQIQNRRGIYEQTTEGDFADYLRIKATIPLAETLDFTPKLMSLTEGRATMNITLKCFRKVPDNISQNLKILKKEKQKV
jgi:elongation factor 2